LLLERQRISGQLVAELHVGRPDVVEELDLDHRLEAARRHADGAADDVGLGQGRVVDAVAAEAFCSPVVTLNTPPLPLTSARHLLAASVGDVLAEHHDARVAPPSRPACRR
jgi:hypothetical protein